MKRAAARVGAALGSSVLLVLCFPRADLGPLAWVALVPLLLAVRGCRGKHAFGLGWLSGFAFYLGLLYWVALISTPGLVALTAFLALYTGLFAWIAAAVDRRGWGLSHVLVPAAWTGLELARTHLLGGFPWGAAGYTQHRVLPLIQVASLGGVYAVSFLVVGVNAACAWALARAMDALGRRGDASAAPARGRPWAAFAQAAAWAALPVFAYAWGSGRTAEHDAPRPWRVALVQGNFALDYRNMAILGSAERQVEIMRVHRALSREALAARPDLVVWSETTYPIPIPEHFDGVHHPEEPLLSLTNVLARLRVPHLVGADEIRRETRPRGRPRLYNSALLLNRRGRITGRYRKQHLVPFGEKTPLEDVLPFMDSVVARAGGGGFVAGKGPGVVRLRAGARELPMGVLICYEAAFPALARRRVADGARVLVNLTNDAWFGGTSNPYQHAAMAIFRAVENRTPLLRCANTGITFAVRETGRVENPVRGPRGERMDIRGWVAQSVTPGRGPTVYSRCGDLFAGLCAAGAGLFLLAALVRRWKGA